MATHAMATIIDAADEKIVRRDMLFSYSDQSGIRRSPDQMLLEHVAPASRYRPLNVAPRAAVSLINTGALELRASEYFT